MNKKRISYLKIKFMEKLNLFNMTIISCGITHVIYSLIFLALRVWELAIFNLCSCLFYSFIYFKVKKNTIYMLLVGLEVWIYTVFAYLYLGPNCGFQLFLLVMIQACIFIEYVAKNRVLISYILSFISALIYLMLMLYDKLYSPIYLTIANEQIIFIHAYNFFIAFTICLSLSLIFTVEIRSKEKGLKNQNIQLTKLATIDPLTNLLNRRSINEYLEMAMHAKNKFNIEFSVAIGDIDDFKLLNDKYGHDCGDVVLKSVAKIIKKNVRELDYVCRWGGEEILILFSNSDMKEAKKIIDRIHNNINELNINYRNERIPVTMTFGMCSSDEYYLIQDIILQADANMYEGKNKGKNCVIYS